LNLIRDQMKLVESIPVQLPHPRDPRARKLADRLRANPCEQQSLETLSMECGASKRTMQRLFTRRRAACPSADGVSRRASSTHCNPWQQDNPSPMPRSMPATAQPAPSSPCSGNNSEPRPRAIWLQRIRTSLLPRNCMPEVLFIPQRQANPPNITAFFICIAPRTSVTFFSYLGSPRPAVNQRTLPALSRF
jgi:AraC-like DNA-binding protein